MRKESRGFTLIEVIMVMAIMGIISSIVVLPMNQIVSKNKLRADIQTAVSLQAMIDIYRVDYDGELPAGLPAVGYEEIKQQVYQVLLEQGYINQRDLLEGEIKLQTSYASLYYHGEQQQIKIHIDYEKNSSLKNIINQLSSYEQVWIEKPGEGV